MTGSGQLTKIKHKILSLPIELKPGMIALIDYTNRHGISKSKLYLILDVNPKLSRTLHCLELNKVPVEQLYKLLEFGLRKKPLLREFKQYKVPVIVFMKSPRQNYEYNIKQRLKSAIPGSYKVLNFNGISKLYVVDYDWEKFLVDKYVEK